MWHYDVTERRRQTDESRRINDALASEIAERTRAEEDAGRAKDQAETHLAELHEVQERLLRQVMQQHGGGAEFSRTDPGHTTLCLWLPLNVDEPPGGCAVAAGAQ